MTDPVLARFSPATRAWFSASFAAPTAAQAGAWTAISAGEDAVVVAPTGSGKTLSAFLWALDRLSSTPPPTDAPRCRVLYISPLKALAVDVERNLRAPLAGIAHAARRLGLPEPDVTVAMRSGDTPPADRARFVRTPTDILITTPESLFLMLTSAAREALRGVETVIIDEVHAVAGTKRGAHLALTLERLDALLDRPAQRIGLSATVRPVEEVGRYLSGGRPVTIVQPPSTKEWDLRVVVPVPDMADPASAGRARPAPGGEGPAEGSPMDEGLLARDASGEPQDAAPRPIGELLPSPDQWSSLPGSVDDLALPEHLTLSDLVPSSELSPQERASIWPHVEERIVDLVSAHRSTLVFANSRRLAERLTTRLNEIWWDRTHEGETAAETDRGAAAPAQVLGQAGTGSAAPPVLARAHHGSVSKEQRAEIEEALKAGQLPAVVATSSLELGIDMGAVDLVIQVESPPSVASGLQRVGRAGHQVGAVSRGVLFPKYRGDLVQTAVVVEGMRRGTIEQLSVPANPLDVLAQQVVAMCAMDDWTVDDILRLANRAASFSGLSRAVLESVLDMLAGRYPSEQFGELRPRLVWDRSTDTLQGRPGAQRLAVTSGGTIPDRGLYGVFLASGEGPGRRVGELDEEMVYESRVGDVFTLGTSSWRIEDITHDRVLVTPAPGQPGRLPFWRGDQLGRPYELGAALGSFVRELVGLGPEAARERVAAAGLDEWATDNLLTYLAEQREATGTVPDDRTVLIERFRDELGDWRVVVHSPYGQSVHAPWALAVAARMRERFGVDVQAVHADDGIVLRLPDLVLDGEEGTGLPGGTDAANGARLDELIAEIVILDPDEVWGLVTEQIGGSALFASRFRECAARALLLPRRRPDRRQALWQQRQRASQLLEVASQFPEFPIILETVRECLQDVFDVPGLVDLMRRLGSREVRMTSVQTPTASPFAQALLFGYVAEFLYDGDSPLAERRAAALALDPALLADLLGQGEGSTLRDLLDPQAVLEVEAELQRLTEDRRARHAEDVADLVRVLGPIAEQEVAARAVAGTTPTEVAAWLRDLEAARRLVRVRVGGEERWAAVEDVGRLRDALGVPVPAGVAHAFLEAVPDPLGDLVERYARTHGPFTPDALAAWLGVGRAVVIPHLRRLVGSGRLSEGALRPLEAGGGDSPDGVGPDFCDADVLRRLRRRSLAALRAEVEPVESRDLARFLPAWQNVGSRLRGLDGVVRVVEQLAGARLPASAVETLVLPARVQDYSPALLDELLATGEVLWQGHGALAGDDGWVSLHLADQAPWTLQPPEQDPPAGAGPVIDALAGGGAWFFRDIGARTGSLDDAALTRDLWDAVWSGTVTSDTWAPVRALLAGGRTTHKQRRAPARRGRWSGRTGLGAPMSGLTRPSRPELPSRSGPPSTSGRWSLLPEVETDPTARAVAAAEVLLDRYGVVSRGPVVAEEVPGGFAAVYRVLAQAEEAGRVRRGYFVEHLGASQFATAGAVDRLRTVSPATARPDDVTDPPAPPGVAWGAPHRQPEAPHAIVLSACDPANPYGAALPWPDRPGDSAHRPGRKAGALVAMADGELLVYLERGGRTAMTFTEDQPALTAAASALAETVRDGRVAALSVERIDGESALTAPSPLVAALQQAGFHTTTKGLRMRR